MRLIIILVTAILISGCSDSHPSVPTPEQPPIEETSKRYRQDAIHEYAADNFIFGSRKWGAKNLTFEEVPEDGRLELREYPVWYIWNDTGAQVLFHYDVTKQEVSHNIGAYPVPEGNS